MNGTRVRWLFQRARNSCYISSTIMRINGVKSVLQGNKLYWRRGLYEDKGRHGVEVRDSLPKSWWVWAARVQNSTGIRGRIVRMLLSF
jgi:hypothetical protein